MRSGSKMSHVRDQRRCELLYRRYGDSMNIEGRRRKLGIRAAVLIEILRSGIVRMMKPIVRHAPCVAVSDFQRHVTVLGSAQDETRGRAYADHELQQQEQKGAQRRQAGMTIRSPHVFLNSRAAGSVQEAPHEGIVIRRLRRLAHSGDGSFQCQARNGQPQRCIAHTRHPGCGEGMAPRPCVPEFRSPQRSP